MFSKGREVEHLIWTDLCGVRRAKCLIARRQLVGKVCKIVLGLPAYADIPAEGVCLPLTGEYQLVPPKDCRQFDVIDAKLSYPVKTKIVELREEDGTSANMCARSILRKALDTLKQEFGLGVTIGFELEFCLLYEDTHKPVDSEIYGTSYAAAKRMDILVEMVHQLETNGIMVNLFHAESGHGQFEIVLTHSDALSACDNVTIAREIIKLVALKHGLVASFIPKISPMQCGSANHCHIGLVDEHGKNAFGSTTCDSKNHGLSGRGEQFMAGVLDHIKSLLPLTTSSPNSFERIKPNCWAGAFQVWGFDNRETPIRLCATSNLPSTNFEIKAFDHTGNAYAGVAGIVFAGLIGLREELSLPPPCQENPGDESTLKACAEAVLHMKTDDPSKLTAEDIAAACEELVFPSTIAEAAAALSADTKLSALLGTDFVQTIVALRNSEHKYFESKTPKEAVEILLTRY
mmetsp:Transcript_5027/g.7648  ORF Transcript_5027/g.7648 Transcript_5027/m.7648 type:complete len:461 (+) Transcript_5027:362-1744(+)|eukprot:CAMPEP_0203761980 /NCGR_PEP_ID=MMETSP0098-20131031/14956_1 /ASSEMBLY_ACC=CAM_ASM_000208 /TAXON_ID=96639 /ORGANISM=" , Strain NY0313808BC1" /LENGTH=460 /DNA_ID=CAMNT_0050656199 /DNA_START=366 /DNA_END=1748 /DNA_ORIENTATION=-